MARFLKQSTSVDVPIGPFLDETDGKTAETALTLTQPDIRLKKNGGAWAQKAAAQTLSHEENGYYEVTLDATDTNTLGLLRLAVHESGALPIWEDFIVLAANIYDSLIGGGDVLDVSVIQLLGTAWLAPGTAGTPDVNAKLIGATAQTGRDLGVSVLLSSGTGAGQLDFTSGVVKANLAQILGTALTETAGLLAAGFKKFFNIATPTGTINNIPDAVAGAASGLAIVGSNMGTVSSVTGNVGGNVVGSVASVTAGVTLAASAIQAVWDALTSALTTVGSIGKLIVDNLNATISSRASQTSLDTVDDLIDTEVSAIKTKTDQLTFTVANQVDANVQAINDTALIGNGDATPWGPV